MGPAHVLYVDWAGHPAPLSECFHATASRRLSSAVDRFPPSTLTQVDSAYCPHCLAFQDAPAYSRSPFCPKPTCQRCPFCNSQAHVSAVVADAGDETHVCVYQCGACGWSSQQCGLVVPIQMDDTMAVDRFELMRCAEDLHVELKQRRDALRQPQQSHFKGLKEYYEEYAAIKDTQTNNARVEPWSLEMLEKRLQATKNELSSNSNSSIIDASKTTSKSMYRRLSLSDESQSDFEAYIAQHIPTLSFQLQSLNSSKLPLQTQDLLPLPTPLRVRMSRRCRADVKEGRPGILIKPKLNPLDGDSSQRTGTQWMKKDCSAVHDIPSVKVVSCTKTENNVSMLLKVNNPNLDSLRFRFAPSSYQGETDWENTQQLSQSLHSVLVDSLTQTRVDANISLNVLKDMAPSATVELSSSEDSIIELQGRAMSTPDEVTMWQPAAAESRSKVELVAQSRSIAWFDLSLTLNQDDESMAASSYIAVPLALEIELGEGSWESSLIPPSTSHLQEGKADRVGFDLLVLVGQQ